MHVNINGRFIYVPEDSPKAISQVHNKVNDIHYVIPRKYCGYMLLFNNSGIHIGVVNIDRDVSGMYFVNKYKTIVLKDQTDKIKYRVDLNMLNLTTQNTTHA